MVQLLFEANENDPNFRLLSESAANLLIAGSNQNHAPGQQERRHQHHNPRAELLDVATANGSPSNVQTAR